MLKEELETIPTSTLVEELDRRMAVYRSVIQPLPAEVKIIVTAVCQNFFITETQIMSTSRVEGVVWARFAAMAIIYSCHYTLTETGGFFGRGHDGVIWGNKRVEELLETSRVFRHRFENSLKAIKRLDSSFDPIPTPHRAAG